MDFAEAGSGTTTPDQRKPINGCDDPLAVASVLPPASVRAAEGETARDTIWSMVVGWLGVVRMNFLRERARDVSKSPRALVVLGLLATHAACAQLDVDGRATCLKRSALLTYIPALEIKITREALRKLLFTLQAARRIEVNGRLVRRSRSLLDEFAQIPRTGNFTSAMPSGADPAATPKGLPDGTPKGFPDGMPKGLPDGMPNSRKEYPAGWASAELESILKCLQAASGQ